jgi:hypothetical protein
MIPQCGQFTNLLSLDVEHGANHSALSRLNWPYAWRDRHRLAYNAPMVKSLTVLCEICGLRWDSNRGAHRDDRSRLRADCRGTADLRSGDATVADNKGPARAGGVHVTGEEVQELQYR